MRKCTTRVGKVKQRAPRRSHLDPKGCPKGAKRVPKGSQSEPKGNQNTSKDRLLKKLAESTLEGPPPCIYFPIHFGSNFSSKTDEQTNAKFHVVKV